MPALNTTSGSAEGRSMRGMESESAIVNVLQIWALKVKMGVDKDYETCWQNLQRIGMEMCWFIGNIRWLVDIAKAVGVTVPVVVEM
jgi:hypothetical protein